MQIALAVLHNASNRVLIRLLEDGIYVVYKIAPSASKYDIPVCLLPKSFTNCTFCCALSGWPTEYFLITITTIGEVQRDIICSGSAHAELQPKYSFISLAGGKIARQREGENFIALCNLQWERTQKKKKERTKKENTHIVLGIHCERIKNDHN